jgi:alpha-amylase/alpha-mannosidase (GH57 family)
MQKYICVHGHFYQPPRENPWLETVELQDSAAPYHDWNERITVECYAPNATARIKNSEGRIERIVSNYSQISFNFGPTLLAWMKDKMPEIHDAIVEADKLSMERFSGHGAAMAQVYNHMILPLANRRDKHTQVLWGIRDFEWRFGRKPEGMWLSETAADTETFEVLAELGIKFTILSPYQASRIREFGKRQWRDVSGGKIDPSRPYLARLPSGRTLTLFFYDAGVSQAVAFEKLLESGDRFAHRLMGAFNDRRRWEQMVHIATDGESYGHHHRHGEMALSYALQLIEKNNWAKLTNYGEYLEKHPPNREVQIHEKSAWSCSHGVGRWMVDCGCNSGGHAGWNQSWRTPLRHALDWLRDELGPLYEAKARELLKDPWRARDEYISIILDRAPENREKFFNEHALRPLDREEQVTVLKLLELQRHAMLMYTSCGWFFDEVSGIESVQVVQYAARALQLAGELFDRDLEPGFLKLFEGAKSNIQEHCDGRCIYEKFVKPAMIDMPKVTAHYAISSIFEEFPERLRIFSYTFEDEDRRRFVSGKTQLAIGRVRVTSEITKESGVLSYAMLYMGEHNLTGGVRFFKSPEAYDTMLREIKEPFESADYPEAIRRIDQQFGQSPYSLRSLFKDELRRILNGILAQTQEDLEGRFRLITERYTPLMKFLESVYAPLPPALQTVSDYILQRDLRGQFDGERLDLDRLRWLVQEATARSQEVLDADLSFVIKTRLEKEILSLAEHPDDLERIQMLEQVTALVVPLPLGLNLWKVQNTYWKLMQDLLPAYMDRAEGGDEFARDWVRMFLALGQRLKFAVRHLELPKEMNERHSEAA